MSLLVWLPLTKDLRNQGINGATVINNGATYSSTGGKLGGCYSFDGSDDYFQLSNINLNGMPELSISFWCYSTAAERGIILFRGAAQFRLHLCTHRIRFRDSNNTASLREIPFTDVPLNTWTHLTYVYNRGEIWVYQNGIEVAHNTSYYHSNSVFLSDLDEYRIGRIQSTSGNAYFSGRLNDIRIYDHCLSEMEVKQLSQGLVLHYLLHNTFPNLINLDTIENDKYFLNTTYSTTPKWCATDFISVYPNTSYIGQGFSNGGSNTYVAIFDKNKVATRAVLITAKQDVNLTTTGDEYFVRLSLRQFEDEYLTATFKQVSNIEYDISGFCNNGTRMGTFSWTSDTPKYEVSSVHTGSNYIYLDSPPTETQTIAVWAKWNTIPSGQSVILVDNGSGIGLGLMSTGILCSTSKAGNSYTFSKANLVANTWYHFVIVKTGTTTRKLYINGVEQTATSNISNWTYSVNQLQLGKRSTTSDGFVGKLCDFRAYATALSASDVKSLYQNCATIDPDGTIRGQIRS